MQFIARSTWVPFEFTAPCLVRWTGKSSILAYQRFSARISTSGFGSPLQSTSATSGNRRMRQTSRSYRYAQINQVEGRKSFNLHAKFWSIKFPPAPLSIRAVVSTVSLFFSPIMVTGIWIELPFISANSTEWISRQGEANVDLVLPFKNPLRWVHRQSSWFLLLLRECVGQV